MRSSVILGLDPGIHWIPAEVYPRADGGGNDKTTKISSRQSAIALAEAEGVFLFLDTILGANYAG